MIVRRCWVALGSALLAAALVAGPVGVAHAAPTPTPGAPENPTAPRSTHGGDDLASVGVVAHPAPGVPPLPGSTFSSYVVVDADTGEVLAAKDAHGRYLPASTIKLLTALVLLPKLDPAKSLVATPDIAKVEGTKVGIVAGASYKVDDLFRAMLMSSGNDAALMLAEAGGGVATTVAEMNAEARALGAGDTLARNPHGLDAEGQLSSSYDLALIFRAAMQLPAFRAYVAQPRATFPGPNGSTYQIQSHNRLLGHYPGMIGAKNGGTKAAGSTYVGEATRDGHSIIVALMHGPGTYRQQVEALFDWGFAARGKVEPVGVLTGPDHTGDGGSSAVAGGAPGAKSATGQTGDGVLKARNDGGSPTSAAAAHGGGMGAWEILGLVVGGLAVAVVALRVRAVRRMRRRRHQRYLEHVATVSGLPPVTRKP